MFKSLFAVVLASITCLNASEMPEPFASIKVMPEYPFGYYVNANQISEIFKNNDIYVE